MLSVSLPLIAFAGPSVASEAKIEPSVYTQLAANQESTVWIILHGKANLEPAFAIKNWEARGQFVYNRLQAMANASQAGVRGLLQSRGAKHRPFFIVNAIEATADAATIKEVSRLPEVEKIVADRPYQIPEPTPGRQYPAVNGVEWNIDRIRAPEVWSTFGVRGESIVVASIDTGVQFDHPALVNQYRGRQPDGSFDHNYNWFDPSNICGVPSTVPCDNESHGTHTMGTMVGDDGTNQIGVAPGATWITAKGCETNGCSLGALMASMQWMLAPTDLNGNNPRPDLRPNIVNNSWGDGPGDSTFRDVVQAWVAAGIFPAFSIGNAGPGCRTAGSPGDYPESYAAGAFDIGNNIAWFSSRGPSAFGGVKPNVAAPGVDVRSSVPGNGYGSNSGTSMASPHVAAAVALMWSAAPSLIGDVAATRELLDQTAIDVQDTSCDGSYPGPADAGNANNVWGEGRLDAFAAVDLSPRGPMGMLQGTVVDASTQAPIVGASVQMSGPASRHTTTDANGFYSMRLPVGVYDVSIAAFGYLPQTVSGVSISQDATTTQNFALTSAPRYTVSGYVRDFHNAPVANTTLTILGVPIPPATTDADGFYSFANVPAGTYDVQAVGQGCNDSLTQSLVVSGDVTLDFALRQRVDAFGYSCEAVPFSFIDANTVVPLYGDDSATTVALPFPFIFYGQIYNYAYVSTNGFLNFQRLDSNLGNVSIPNPYSPNAAIYPFWDDLYVDEASSVRSELLGTAPNRRFVIEWRDVAFCCVSQERVRFEVVLYENGRILMQYTSIDAEQREQGNSATMGIEDENGWVGLQYSFDQPTLREDTAVLYRLPPSGFVRGYVTDNNDHQPMPSAFVQAIKDGSQVQATWADDQGFYQLQLPVGTYTVEASQYNYTAESAQLTVAEDRFVQQDFALRTARVEVSRSELEFIMPPNQTRTIALTLRNTGTESTPWWLYEDYDVPWLSEEPMNGDLAAGATQIVHVTANSSGMQPGWSNYAYLYVGSNSGRMNWITIPVRLIVPRYRVAVNTGGNAYTDQATDPWAADQAYTAGSYGYFNRSSTVNTRSSIAGTDDDALYQDARRGQVEYRFDGLPQGTYQVELRFAEIQGLRPGQRVFDVAMEDKAVLTGFDIRSKVPGLTADDRSFFVTVTDGQLNIRFLTRRGFGEPIINAIRVTDRPDR
ncbi:MAG TPA: carboxypeptidase regulatory-like domain-containing protein [Herpetosiphonaceae bacterium]